MKEETSVNVWKESLFIKIRFLTRNDDLRQLAGNWTWPETGPHTVRRLKDKVAEVTSSEVIVSEQS